MFTVIAAWLVGSSETKHAVFLKRYRDSKFFQWAIFLCKASFCLPCSDQYELLIVSDFFWSGTWLNKLNFMQSAVHTGWRQSYHPLLCMASSCSTILWTVCCWTLHTAVLCSRGCWWGSPQCCTVCMTWRSPRRTSLHMRVCREGQKISY